MAITWGMLTSHQKKCDSLQCLLNWILQMYQSSMACFDVNCQNIPNTSVTLFFYQCNTAAFNRGDKYLPYYWPKQLNVLSILHFLYFLPLHVKPKASIYSSSLAHTTATTKKRNKKYSCDTVQSVNTGGIFFFIIPYSACIQGLLTVKPV